MTTPSDRQVETEADVERIAAAMFNGMRELGGLTAGAWNVTPTIVRSPWRALARALLQRDMIRVGRRPEPPEPLEGQEPFPDAA